MTVFLLLPSACSALFQAAHFLRAGLALPAALAVRRRWIARCFQAGLALAAAEWLRTLAAVRAERLAAGEPWIRMACILGGVAALALAAALLFQTARLSSFYRLDRR